MNEEKEVQYKINDEIKKQIFEFIKVMEIVNIESVSFEIFDNINVIFYIDQLSKYYELRVCYEKKIDYSINKFIDCYKIKDTSIIYDYSEKVKY